MINKHTLLNNKLMTNSTGLIRDIRLKGRALVCSGLLENELASSARLTDFFDVVIAESVEAKNKLGFADIVFYNDGSAYKDGLFALDQYSDLQDTIIMMNFGAIRDLVKLKKDLGIYNLNYVPTNCECSGVPGGPLQNELNSKALGVHLALILGCTTVYSDQPNANSTSMNSEQLKAFLTVKTSTGAVRNSMRPANMLSVGRTSILKASF